MRNKKLKKIIATVCCLFFVFSLFILFSNLHFHVINNGFLIFHSHPYDKSHHNNSPVKSHYHSDLEFFIYHSVATNDGLVLSIFIFLIFSVLIKYLFISTDTIIQNNRIFLLPILRAPPLKFSFNC
jgi:hypothetical protein